MLLHTFPIIFSFCIIVNIVYHVFLFHSSLNISHVEHELKVDSKLEVIPYHDPGCKKHNITLLKLMILNTD